MPTKYEIDTVSYVNTLLHTFSPTLYGEFTVGVNWAHQYTSPFDEAARDANDRRRCCPGCRSSSRRRIRSNIIPQATFTGGVPGNPLSVRHRAAVPLLRLQHAVQRLGQRHEGQRRAHHEGRLVRGAHNAARRRGRRASTATSASTPTARTRATPTSASPMRCLARSPSTPNPTAIRRRMGSSSSPSGTRRTPGG